MSKGNGEEKRVIWDARGSEEGLGTRVICCRLFKLCNSPLRLGLTNACILIKRRSGGGKILIGYGNNKLKERDEYLS